MSDDVMKKRKKYSRKSLLDALDAIKCGRSFREVSVEFGIPKTTLLYKHKGTHPIDGKSGPPRVLNDDEEEEIVSWIHEISELGFALTKNQMLSSVQSFIKQLGRKSIFPDDKPGKHWCKHFELRHPEINGIFKKNLSYSKTAPSESSVREWFEKTKKCLEENDLLDVDPNRMFTCDEAALVFNPNGKRVIARKGDRSEYNFLHNHVYEAGAALFVGNASGILGPPMVVFKEERIRPIILQKIPEGWSVGKTNDGWSTKDSFHEYITKVFSRWLSKNNIKRPIALFIDGNSCFPTQSLTEYCKEHKIILLPIHPNTGHILQPLDNNFFISLKDAWQMSVEHWRDNNNRRRVKKPIFAPLLSQAFTMMNIIELLTNGFRDSGLFPFSPNSVDFRRKGRFKSQAVIKTNDEIQGFDMMDTIIDTQYPAEEVRKHLEFLEDFIEDEKLKKFREDEGIGSWTGDVKDSSLFQLWKKLRKLSNDPLNTDATNEFNEIFTSPINDVAGVSRGHFMSIDDGSTFQAQGIICGQSILPHVYSETSSMQPWIGSNLEKLN